MRAQSGITSLEQWVQCGAAYFVTRVLGARTDDTDPTDIVDIEAREKGSLVHRVFEVLIGEWIDANPALDRPWIASVDDLRRVLQRAEAVLDAEAEDLMARHRLGHPHMWRARRSQIVTALRHGLQAELDDGATPLATEFSFGIRHDTPPVVWQSPVHADVDVHFTGSIDRLDRMPDGTLRVMDLKIGRRHCVPVDRRRASVRFRRRQAAARVLRVGHGAGPRSARAPRRVSLRGASRHRRRCVLQLDDAVQQALHARLDRIATSIRDGEFLPGEVGTWGCDVCSPDKLGADETNQRLGQWFAHAGIDARPASPDEIADES